MSNHTNNKNNTGKCQYPPSGEKASPQVSPLTASNKNIRCMCRGTFTKYLKSEIDELCRDWLILQCTCGAQKGAVLAQAEDRSLFSGELPTGIRVLLDPVNV